MSALRPCLAALLACLSLTACGGPRYEVVPHAAAVTDQQVRTVKVLRVLDGIKYSRDPSVTHLIEVEIVEGPGAGQRQTWPYDDMMTGREPPAEGSTLDLAPNSWVRRDRKSGICVPSIK